MRLHLISDVHTEFDEETPFSYDVPECDVVVAAGDIGVGMDGFNWLMKTFPDKPVVYVAGNHEFYRQNRRKLILKLEDAARGTNIHFLEKSSVDLFGVCFLGTTLWTDFDGGNYLSMMQADQGMNDFRLIDDHNDAGDYYGFKARNALHEHRIATSWLKMQLSTNADAKTVVVGHHAPSFESVGPEHRGSKLNGAYASELSELMFTYSPNLWVHGHMHACNDYTIGETRVVSNPRGYAKYDENQNFDTQLVLEV